MKNQEYLSDFINNLKYYRNKKKLSQAKLAELCNYSDGMIGAIEAGRAKPSFDMILAIAEALDIHPADLFLRDTSMTKSELKNTIQTSLIDSINSVLAEHFPN